MKQTFENWLQQNGAEILPPTNEYEAVRFVGKETGVMYKSGKFSNKYAYEAYNCYKTGKKWDGKPYQTGRQKTYLREKKELQKRDGLNCFYCCEPLNDDITLEHLIPISAGGKNILSNMVLAHEKCNQMMGCKTIHEKVNFAIEERVKKRLS